MAILFSEQGIERLASFVAACEERLLVFGASATIS